ncbi:MAG: hypothetical protein U1E45_22345 [Geminicoccaceae bacterium]
MSDRLLALYGTTEPLPDEVRLTAGPLEATLSGGALRSIRLQGVEVIRGIYFLIRDRNWATVVPDLRDMKIDQRADGFTVSFSAHGATPSDGQTLVWNARIEGSAQKGVTFTADATPDQDFVTCRTGFIMLHPLEGVVGCPVRIEHTDGSVDETAFPDLIDPIQSFFDIRAMTHEPVPGVKATCRMKGGAWETEDHRNWLDASFKTYFRPLALPWPYTVPKGERIQQTISLTFEPAASTLSGTSSSATPAVTVGDRTGARMPTLGLAVMPHELDACLAAAGKAREAGVQSLAIRIASNDKDLPGVLRKAAKLATALNAAPVLEIVLAGKAPPAVELDLVAVAAHSAGLSPAAIVVTTETDLHSYPPSVDRPASAPLNEVYAAARAAFPGVRLGGGMFSYFTEMNRRRPPVEHLDFVQHATAAVVHAADDLSVMETLESLPHVFRSTRAFAGGKAYHVGPANIGMAFNPYGASTSPNPDRLKRTMVTDDPRCGAQFGAAWATGYLARAVQGGLDSVTLLAPAGFFGIVQDGRPTTSFHVIKGFAALAGAAVVQTASSDPQRVLAAAAKTGGVTSLWIANLTGEPLTVGVAGLRSPRVEVLAGGGSGFQSSALGSDGSLELDAYAVARLVG